MNEKKKVKIKAEKVLVKFGPIVALDNFSCEIPEGVVGLLGPNGAGKSTFIRTVLGLIEPNAGKITVNGLDTRDNITSLRDKIGYMPEDECLIQNLDAFDLVSYMGQLSGLVTEDAVRRSHEVLDFVGLGEERYREISTFSTGMKQRVKLAQALVHDPDLLFLDEPTNGMDPSGKEEMLSLIEDLGDFDKTVLICSHLLHEVERVSDYVLIINQGRLLKSGELKEILKGEKDRYKLTVKGTEDSIRSFGQELENHCQMINVDNLKGKTVFLIKNLGSSLECFQLAKNHGVQIRSYTPEKLSLEDAFIEAFEKGEEYGG